jgi:hypothetical protein
VTGFYPFTRQTDRANANADARQFPLRAGFPMRAGEMFYIPPGHDSWVVGNEPYVSLHFAGATDYAKHD